MSTDRTQRLSPGELALKLACREAVKAAGGQEFVAAETGRTQSRISDYLSPNTRDFMPIDVVSRVEALSAGAPGHPHISRALSRAQGMILSGPPGDSAPCSVTAALAQVASESSDVIGLLAKLAAGGLVQISDVGADPVRLAALVGEIEQLITVLGGLKAGMAPPPEARADSS